jgi:hypothetical protein
MKLRANSMHKQIVFFRLISPIFLVLAGLLGSNSGYAQDSTDPPQVEYTFGDKITVSVELSDPGVVESVQAIIRSDDTPDTWQSRLVKPESSLVSLEFNPKEMGLRTFSKLITWIETTYHDGQTASSPEVEFYYEDNRFEWKTRLQEPFEVFWYDGDSAFGLSLLDVAQLGLTQIQTLLPVPSPQNLRLYAYADAVEMRATLQNSARNWVGAHTDPDLGVMVLSLPPGPEQRLEMERQIPHELMHILLYQKVGPAYINIPAWLNEGLSSVAELYPNPDYQILLESAYEKGTLLPISSLCNALPRDAAGAYLAYAESASFTRYLHEQYGSLLIDQLVRQYANGLDCERGIEVALGSSLSQLERDWRRETLGEDPWQTALTNLAPWLLLLAAILVLPIVLVIVTLRGKAPAKAHVQQGK